MPRFNPEQIDFAKFQRKERRSHFALGAVATERLAAQIKSPVIPMRTNQRVSASQLGCFEKIELVPKKTL